MFAGGGASVSLETKLKRARTSGALNLSNCEFGMVPPEVLRLTDNDALAPGEKFWEVVDLENLDLSHNLIEELPAGLDFGAFPMLKVLRAARNRLSRIHPGVGSLETLLSLRLEHNKLRSLPDELGGLMALQELDVSFNELYTLPEAVCLPQLKHFRCKGNRLRDLPDGLGTMPFLATLDASDNALSAVPASLAGCRRLTTLDLSGNSLCRGFPSLAQLSSLAILNLRGNHLGAIPELPHLDAPAELQLFLGENKFRGPLDASPLLACYRAVVTLDISNNHIEALRGDEIGVLVALKSLDLRNNDLTEVPHELGYLRRLQRVLLEGNPLRSLRRGVYEAGTEAFKKYLRTRGPPPRGLDEGDLLPEEASPFDEGGAGRGGPGHASSLSTVEQAVNGVRDANNRGTMDLSKAGLRAFPYTDQDLQEIAELLRQDAVIYDFDTGREMSGVVPLKTLKLDNNEVDTLPDGLRFLDDLQTVSAARNKLRDLGAGFSQLQIRHLDVQRNALTAAALAGALSFGPQPGPICNTLTTLNLMSNHLEEVPAALYGVYALQELDLSYNSLRDLGSTTEDRWGWHCMPNLTTLNAGNNSLATLGSLATYPPPALKDLNVENNDIRDIPPELGLHEELRTLNIHGNPQKRIRTSTISQGAAAILKVLRQRLPEGFTPPPPLDPPGAPERAAQPPPSHRDLDPRQDAAQGQGDRQVTDEQRGYGYRDDRQVEQLPPQPQQGYSHQYQNQHEHQRPQQAGFGPDSSDYQRRSDYGSWYQQDQGQGGHGRSTYGTRGMRR